MLSWDKLYEKKGQIKGNQINSFINKFLYLLL